MTDRMRDTLERELQQHAAALRGLARDLVGAVDADDVVQETALQALRTPPVRGGSLGGWLAGIVRHVASRHRRAEARRVRREQVAAREPIAADASADDGDTLRFLTDAVLALPQPYRAVVFARYLKDLTPAEIAAHSDESVGTIKTRLKRGLALLRERFDVRQRERGGDWRGALAGAFGLEQVTAAAGIAGVIVMSAAMKWTLGTAAAAMIVAGLVVFAGNAPWNAVPLPTDGRERAEVAVAALPEAPAREGAPGVPAARDAIAGSTSPAEPRVSVRGRCIDENGTPLPGLAVELRGSKVEGGMGRDFEREYGEWIVARGGRRWANQQGETAADGTFEFAAERTPMSVSLAITRDAMLRTTSLWWGKQTGLDLGDIVVPIACTLRCRVVDTDGRVVPTPQLRIQQEPGPAPESTVFAVDTSVVRAGVDGVVSSRVIRGPYRCDVPGHDIVRGGTFDVPTGASTWAHDVVVAAMARADTITGTVVDERGTPIADADVVATRAGHDKHSYASTDALGRFVLPRRGHPAGAVDVTCSKRGFDDKKAHAALQWGEHDRRFVLRDLAAVEVHVVDAESREPVTDYAVWSGRIVDEKGAFEHASQRTSSEHAGGVVRVAGLARGKSWLWVEPHRFDLWRSDIVTFDADAERVQRIDVRVHRAASRMLRLRRGNGSPVDDARIDVIAADAAAPGAVGAGLRTVTIDRWNPVELPFARVLLHQAQTDERGESRLRGPLGAAVVLRIDPDGRAPFVVGPVSLDDPNVLDVTVPAGASLKVRVGPPEFVILLQAVQNRAHRWPGFRLRRGDERDAELVPRAGSEAWRLDADGTFTIRGVPPGDWQLALEPWESNGGQSVSLVWGAVPIAAVALRDGETIETSVDLASWLLGTITGIVRCNGVVVANAQIGVEVLRTRFETGKPARWLTWANTDADGRFRYVGRGGTVTVLVERSGGGLYGARPNWVAATLSAELLANGTVERDFDVVSCPVRVRLLGHDGSAVAGADVVLTTPGNWPRHVLGTSNAEGVVTGETEPGTFEVQLGEARTPIGHVTVVPGAPNDFELRAPAGIR